MGGMVNPLDEDKIQQLVRTIQIGKKSKRKIDVLTWGLLSADRISNVVSEIAELNKRIEEMKKAEMEFCVEAYHIVDNVLYSFFRSSENKEFFGDREDLRQSLVLELFKLLKGYDENVDSSFTRYGFSSLKLKVANILFGNDDSEYYSRNERMIKKNMRMVDAKPGTEGYKQPFGGGYVSASYNVNFEDGIIRRQICEQVRNAIDSLSELERKFTFLKFYREHKSKDITRILHITQSQQQTIQRKITSKLKKVLNDDSDFMALFNEYWGAV